MAVSEEYLAYILEQLGQLGRVTPKRMFGCVGLYHDGLFFGLCDDDALYFKVDDGNREDYTSRGRAPFRPFPDKPDYVMGYYDVPGDILDSPEDLATWAKKALAVAARSGKKPAKKSAPAKKATKKR